MVGALDSTKWLTIRILARMHSIAQMRRKSMSELHKTITHKDSSEHAHADLSRHIPHIEFPYGFLTVKDPSDEPLVYLDDEFECDSDYYHWKEIGGRPLPGSSPSIMARQTVRDMLHRAEDMLPEGHHFRILDAYRPIAVQQALWDHYRAHFSAEMPDLTEEELDMHTRTCVSMPSYDVLQPSIHNTGGAVDLTIIGPDGEPLDMGTTFDAFSDATWTDYFEPGRGHDTEAGDTATEPDAHDTANISARKNRRMLYNVMTAAGFTNLPSEWWHYDYGDNMWAQLTGGKAIYAGILDADVRGKV